MNNELEFYPAHPSGEKTHRIETTPMPLLSQAAPFNVKTLCAELNDDFNSALAVYRLSIHLRIY